MDEKPEILLTATETAVKESQLLSPRPLLSLYDITPKDSTVVYRFHASSTETDIGSSIRFQGNDYVQHVLSLSGTSESADDPTDSPVLEISNAGGLVSNAITLYDGLNGARIVRNRVFVGSDNKIQEHMLFAPDVWFIARKVSENSVSVQFELQSPVEVDDISLPRRAINKYCSWTYRDDNCGYTGRSITRAGEYTEIFDELFTDEVITKELIVLTGNDDYYGFGKSADYALGFSMTASAGVDTYTASESLKYTTIINNVSIATSYTIAGALNYAYQHNFNPAVTTIREGDTVISAGGISGAIADNSRSIELDIGDVLQPVFFADDNGDKAVGLFTLRAANIGQTIPATYSGGTLTDGQTSKYANFIYTSENTTVAIAGTNYDLATRKDSDSSFVYYYVLGSNFSFRAAATAQRLRKVMMKVGEEKLPVYAISANVQSGVIIAHTFNFGDGTSDRLKETETGEFNIENTLTGELRLFMGASNDFVIKRSSRLDTCPKTLNACRKRHSPAENDWAKIHNTSGVLPFGGFPGAR